MKNVLLACITIITAIFISIHEVKHINHNDSSSCQICIVGDNLVSSDITNWYDISDFLLSFDNIIFHTKRLNYHLKESTNHPNAPPLKS